MAGAEKSPCPTCVVRWSSIRRSLGACDAQCDRPVAAGAPIVGDAAACFYLAGKSFEPGSRGRRMKTTLRTLAGLMLAFVLFAPAQAASLSAGLAAYEH